MMSGEIPIESAQGCQTLISCADFVVARGLDRAQELENAIGGEIGQVQPGNRLSAGCCDVGQEKLEGISIASDGPGPKPSLDPEVIFEKGEKRLPHAAHWAPPFGAKARKR